jgi:hypothetical protein
LENVTTKLGFRDEINAVNTHFGTRSETGDVDATLAGGATNDTSMKPGARAAF